MSNDDVANDSVADDDSPESSDEPGETEGVPELASLDSAPSNQTEQPSHRSTLNLSYTEPTQAVVDDTSPQLSWRHAIAPTLIAGLTASMIAAGLILLLLLL